MLLNKTNQVSILLAAIFSIALPVLAQPPGPGDDPQAPPMVQRPNGGFRRMDDPQFQPVPGQQFARQPDPGPVAQVPQQITLPAGSWIAIRVNQQLSSERNQPGDSFSASLAKPLIAQGLVIARPGQMLGGRVAEVVKAGRVKGTSRLGIELTELTLADGQQIPIRAQLVDSVAGTSNGRDAAAIGTTAGVGAAIGAAAAGGFGAGMGAIAGAGAAAIGVLATKGRATEIFPEEQITFRTLAPITISTSQSNQAFQPVMQNDYQAPQLQNRIQRPASVPYSNPVPYSNYYGGGYGGFYSPYYSPFFYGPSFGFYTAPRFYGGYYRGGFARRR